MGPRSQSRDGYIIYQARSSNICLSIHIMERINQRKSTCLKQTIEDQEDEIACRRTIIAPHHQAKHHLSVMSLYHSKACSRSHAYCHGSWPAIKEMGREEKEKESLQMNCTWISNLSYIFVSVCVCVC